MVMRTLNSYPKLWNVGHPNVRDIFLQGPVVIEEKLDGSQFSFGVLTDSEEGEALHIRSKGATIYPENPPAMFAPAVETVVRMHSEKLLPIGTVFRGEAFHRPKHNSLTYDRMPKGGIILFGAQGSEEDYCGREELEYLAEVLGLEVVPEVYRGVVESQDQLLELLERNSVLGDVHIEGIAIKPVTPIFGRDGKPLYAKFVSEQFRELHKKQWRTQTNPSGNEICEQIGIWLRSEVRWGKAVQRMRERGELTETPADIGSLLREIGQDVIAECEAEVRDKLFAWGWPRIRKEAQKGIPQWYKEQLLSETNFETGEKKEEKHQ